MSPHYCQIVTRKPALRMAYNISGPLCSVEKEVQAYDLSPPAGSIHMLACIVPEVTGDEGAADEEPISD